MAGDRKLGFIEYLLGPSLSSFLPGVYNSLLTLKLPHLSPALAYLWLSTQSDLVKVVSCHSTAQKPTVIILHPLQRTTLMTSPTSFPPSLPLETSIPATLPSCLFFPDVPWRSCLRAFALAIISWNHPSPDIYMLTFSFSLAFVSNSLQCSSLSFLYHFILLSQKHYPTLLSYLSTFITSVCYLLIHQFYLFVSPL